MKIKMFTKTVCPTCKVAKQQLSYLPVPVDIEEFNIEKDGIIFDIYGDPHTYESYLVNVLDSMSTPTFLFENGTIVRGFEMGQIQEALGL
ncbi:glutaredoxin family protein [Bacillus cereus]